MCTALRAKFRRPAVSASSATARTAKRSRVSWSGRTYSTPLEGRTSSRRLKLTRGMDAVTCQRLSDNVLRWYTDYCQTPIGNTAATPRFPVVAVVHSFMVHWADGRSREEVLGSPLCRIFERPAVGPAAGERARNDRSGLIPPRSEDIRLGLGPIDYNSTRTRIVPNTIGPE